MFKELLIYADTDESGSLFEHLGAHDNILAVTSAGPTESSWMTYCGAEAMVDSHNLGTCLGTTFSTNWLEDSEAHF